MKLSLLLLALFVWVAALPSRSAKGKSKTMTADTEAKLKKSIPGGDLEGRVAKLKKLGVHRGNKNTAATKRIEQPKGEEHTVLNALGDDIVSINQNFGVDEYFLDADINFSDKQMNQLLEMAGTNDQDEEESGHRQKRQMSLIFPKWTDGVVYYELDASLSSKKIAAISAALNYIQSRTCLSFLPNCTAENRVRVFNGPGCYSYIGMIGGVQDISIGDGCSVIGTIAHEFAHALGSFHEHQRYDRDQYVFVDTWYVDPLYQSNFDITTNLETVNYTPYEFGSMMQYPANAFTYNGELSMYPNPPRYLYSMGHGMISFYDIYMLNANYQCFGRRPYASKCSAGSATCANGGYPNPNNCAVCVCASGYTGDLCDQRPLENGGQLFTATTAWQNYTVVLGTNDSQDPAAVRDIYTSRTDWIQAPAGMRVQVALVGSMFNAQCQYGCSYNGVEMKITVDRLYSGIKMCCSTSLGIVYSSSLNPTPIITYNRYYYSSFTIQYRYVV